MSDVDDSPLVIPLLDAEGYLALARELDSGHRLPCEEHPESWTSGDLDDQLVAARACKRCPHMAPCREYAIKAGEPVGVWGGSLPRERRRRRPAPPIEDGTPTPERPEHGLLPYTRGCRCDVCRAAAAAYKRERRAARRAAKKG